MKSILIVGSGPGISLSVAYRFAREGFKTVFVARNEKSLQQLSQKINNTGFQASYQVCDVTDFEKTQQLIKQINEQSPIDVVLYNAAASTGSNMEEISNKSLTNDFEVNVVGAFNVAKASIEVSSSEKPMALLFTGGGLALKPYYEYTSLSIGKAGLRSLVFSLAQQFRNTHVKIGTVTVAGFVKKGTRFDPDRIANEFWHLFADPAKKYEVEVIYK
jgi:NADP-dependent 3-hydroxy acid dehydrogenase YdfG